MVVGASNRMICCRGSRVGCDGNSGGYASENTDDRLYSCAPEKCGRRTGRYSRSVLGEKLALASIGVRGHVTFRCLDSRLAQAGGSAVALLLCDSTYAQCCKGYCYGRCHFRFDG